MENILIVLVVVASLVYKMYTGYKEEMEKAAKRNPQIPRTAPVEATPPPLPKKRNPMEYIGKEIRKTEKTFQKPIVSIDKTPEEVRRVRDTKQRKLALIEEDTSDKNNATIEFNLRQAVIQSIILERPYKY